MNRKSMDERRTDHAARVAFIRAHGSQVFARFSRSPYKRVLFESMQHEGLYAPSSSYIDCDLWKLIEEASR